jgi:hypothetical protein
VCSPPPHPNPVGRGERTLDTRDNLELLKNTHTEQ